MSIQDWKIETTRHEHTACKTCSCETVSQIRIYRPEPPPAPAETHFATSTSLAEKAIHWLFSSQLAEMERLQRERDEEERSNYEKYKQHRQQQIDSICGCNREYMKARSEVLSQLQDSTNKFGYDCKRHIFRNQQNSKMPEWPSIKCELENLRKTGDDYFIIITNEGDAIKIPERK